MCSIGMQQSMFPITVVLKLSVTKGGWEHIWRVLQQCQIDEHIKRDVYKIPSEAKELSVTIKATKPPRKIDWVNQPPRSSQGTKPQHVIKGPVGEPQGKAKDVDTPLDGIVI